MLKCLPAQHGLYALTLEDVTWTLWLESLLSDRPFFEASPEPDDGEEPDDSAPPDALNTRHALRLRLTRWQRQFDAINNALLGVGLSGTIREVIERHESRGPGKAAMPDSE